MRERGLTIIEVVLAVAIIAIIMGILTTTVVTNLKQTSVTGASTQAAQVLNYLGRRVAGGHADVLPSNGAPLTWDYGNLTAFKDLVSGGGVSDPALYKAQIVYTGDVTLASSSLRRYDIEVCHKRAGEHCVSGITFGPAPPTLPNTNAIPPLLGLN